MERSLRTTNKIGSAKIATSGGGRASSKNPLICFHYLTRQLYEMAGTEVFDKHGNHDVDMPPTRPFASSRMTTLVGHINNDANSTSGNFSSQSSYSTDREPTFTPKRRRKEDGRGSRVRFSPEKRGSPGKRGHLRESVSHVGSRLDHQRSPQNEDDEQSHLAGAMIAQPSQDEDELSYSDSDASPDVAAADH